MLGKIIAHIRATWKIWRVNRRLFFLPLLVETDAGLFQIYWPRPGTDNFRVANFDITEK